MRKRQAQPMKDQGHSPAPESSCRHASHSDGSEETSQTGTVGRPPLSTTTHQPAGHSLVKEIGQSSGQRTELNTEVVTTEPERRIGLDQRRAAQSISDMNITKSLNFTQNPFSPPTEQNGDLKDAVEVQPLHHQDRLALPKEGVQTMSRAREPVPSAGSIPEPVKSENAAVMDRRGASRDHSTTKSMGAPADVVKPSPAVIINGET